MKASEAAKEILEELLGLPYLECSQNGRFNWKDCLKEEVDYKALSLRLCERVREKGMRIVWDPEMIERID